MQTGVLIVHFLNTLSEQWHFSSHKHNISNILYHYMAGIKTTFKTIALLKGTGI